MQEVFYDPAKVTVPPFPPDTPETRAELAQYYQSTSRVDQGLGRLMEILKKNGKWENTLILFTSDHGMAFAGGKTTVYEGGLRVPFIVRNPYQKERGNTNNAMLSFVDITPTLLDFAGGYDAETQAAKPELATMAAGRRTKKGPYNSRPLVHAHSRREKSGRLGSNRRQPHFPRNSNVLPHARRARPQVQAHLEHRAPAAVPFASDLWAAPSWQAQWKKGPTAPYGKKPYASIQRPQFELFDISADPNEGVNLAGDEKYAKVLEEYKTKLKSFQNATQDPWVMKWKYE